MKSLFKVMAIGLLGFGAFSTIAIGHLSKATEIGKAYDLSDPSNLLFTETKSEVLVNNVVKELNVVYRDKNLIVIADKKVDFSKSTLHPDYKMEDKKSGRIESCTKIGNDFSLSFKKNKNEVLKSKTIAVPSPAVCDAGFSNVVKENFDKLLKGESVVINMIVPERFDYYSFRYTKVKNVKFSGKDAVLIKMESDNYIIRQLVDPMYLTFDVSTRKLLQYEGVSSISNEKGERYVVKLVY
jgi:hypothetical protein